jgi:two-component system NtrC family sensor kinase
VTDNGGGIPTEYLNTIFDPFFTTKRNQGGTGLGLHIVHNIVHGVLGGTIRVEKGVNGVGTRLVLHLPLNNEGGAVAS